ncbi:MAG: class I SAM-dependent methyltransferase [Spirochaetales bacterium]|uniref:Class I SAM-dependent methyltransferase n=1 Tax=Candidatus Thalassospirochaeta sargassi TaxID=3119039 RepID=A0AAJ1MKJ6_9SPIO|nr:class I SAM-dependent methyltransferase [Spirochaetales bacterium]
MYNLLAKQYSKLFPPDKNRCGFILEESGLKSGSEDRSPAVLDAGCANGDLAFELADAGCMVTGIDLNADMIKIAEKRAASRGLDKPVFLCRSMTELGGLGSYNIITCFGNTLPHLPSEKMVGEFLRESAAILEKSGSLIFQIINFDKIENKEMFEFQDINTDKQLFKRSYKRLQDGRFDFKVSLTDLQTGEQVSDSTPLLALSKKALTDMLEIAGFTTINVYKDYSGEPADGTEFAAIYSAKI